MTLFRGPETPFTSYSKNKVVRFETLKVVDFDTKSGDFDTFGPVIRGLYGDFDENDRNAPKCHKFTKFTTF